MNGMAAALARRPAECSSVWITAGYVAMVAAAIALFALIRGHGETLTAPAAMQAASAAPASVSAKPDVLLHVLLALVAVIVCGRLLGRLFVRLGQPPVIGEVVAGILLGPSLLGWVAPDVYAFLLPTSVAPFLGVIAQLGVILY